jgi:signal transduction histidine kinase/HAMP domain-containing protein
MLGASALLALVLGAGFAVILNELEQLRTVSRFEQTAAEVIAAADRLEDLAVGLHGRATRFAISPNERLLRSIGDTRRELKRQGKELRLLTADPEQRTRAASIEQALRRYDQLSVTRLVSASRADPAGARSLVRARESERRLAGLRDQLSRFRSEEAQLAAERDATAAVQARRARLTGQVALVGSLLLILAFTAYFSRAIFRPIRRVAIAARRLATGELSARVAPRGWATEVGELGRAFNTMAASLETNRRELERQNDELGEKTAELERAVAELAEEKRRVSLSYEFGELLAAEMNTAVISPKVLAELCRLARAETGALYAISVNRAAPPSLVSTFGIEPERLPPVLDPPEALAARALAERRSIVASFGEGFTARALGRDAPVRHELHLPLIASDREVGLIVLTRALEQPFAADEIETIEHLAGQTAIRISNGVTYKRARALADVHQAVLNATRDGIRLVDLEGRTLTANAAIERLTSDVFGLPSDSTLFERSAIAERLVDPESYLATMATIAADPECTTQDVFELASSGRSFERYTAPVRDSADALIGRIIVVREITAERESERLKDEFLAGVSHELRTPLTSICGYLELVLEEESGTLTDEQRHFLSVVERSTQRLLRLVGDLLFVAQADAGALTLERTDVDLTQLVRQCVEAAGPQASAKNIGLSLETRPIPVTNADPARLAQLLDNLVSNALKFTPAGGQVLVRAFRENGRAVLEVEDSGLGIAAEEQERLFERFFRTRAASEAAIQGTGLGLSIAQAIAEGHGGEIGVTSAEGVGTTFRVELPLTGHGEASEIEPPRELAR